MLYLRRIWQKSFCEGLRKSGRCHLTTCGRHKTVLDLQRTRNLVSALIGHPVLTPQKIINGDVQAIRFRVLAEDHLHPKLGEVMGGLRQSKQLDVFREAAEKLLGDEADCLVGTVRIMDFSLKSSSSRTVRCVPPAQSQATA
jgi:hypothetical protein